MFRKPWELFGFASRTAARRANPPGYREAEYAYRIQSVRLRAAQEGREATRAEQRGHAPPRETVSGAVVGGNALRSKEALRRLLRTVKTNKVVFKALLKISGYAYRPKTRKGANAILGKESVTLWLASTEYRPDLVKMANDPRTTLRDVIVDVFKVNPDRIYQLALEPVRDNTPRPRKRKRKG